MSTESRERHCGPIALRRVALALCALTFLSACQRTVDIGDNVKPGQPIARLDPQNEESGAQSARAPLAGANAQLVEARRGELGARTPK